MPLGFEEIRDMSPLSLKKLNDQLRTLWKKIMGELDGRDIKADSIESKHIKAGELVVGEKVQMGEGSVIDWNTVTPPTAYQVGAKPYDWVPFYNDIMGSKPPIDADNTMSAVGSRLTYIDQYGIYTGTLAAEKINAGLMTGVKIKTAPDINYLTLQDQYLSVFYGASERVKLGYVDMGGGLQYPLLRFMSANGVNSAIWQDLYSSSILLKIVPDTNHGGTNISMSPSENQINLNASSGVLVNGNQVLTTGSTITARFA